MKREHNIQQAYAESSRSHAVLQVQNMYFTDISSILIVMGTILYNYGLLTQLICLIFTEFDSIGRGGAEVNTFKVSKYQTIFTMFTE